MICHFLKNKLKSYSSLARKPIEFIRGMNCVQCDCGYTQDRDIHSAINIILAERKEFKPLENDITSSMLKYFKTIPNIEVNIVC